MVYFLLQFISFLLTSFKIFNVYALKWHAGCKKNFFNLNNSILQNCRKIETICDDLTLCLILIQSMDDQ